MGVGGGFSLAVLVCDVGYGAYISTGFTDFGSSVARGLGIVLWRSGLAEIRGAVLHPSY